MEVDSLQLQSIVVEAQSTRFLSLKELEDWKKVDLADFVDVIGVEAEDVGICRLTESG